jgi:hypothetical protein
MLLRNYELSISQLGGVFPTNKVNSINTVTIIDKHNAKTHSAAHSYSVIQLEVMKILGITNSSSIADVILATTKEFRNVPLTSSLVTSPSENSSKGEISDNSQDGMKDDQQDASSTLNSSTLPANITKLSKRAVRVGSKLFIHQKDRRR